MALLQAIRNKIFTQKNSLQGCEQAGRFSWQNKYRNASLLRHLFLFKICKEDNFGSLMKNSKRQIKRLLIHGMPLQHCKNLCGSINYQQMEPLEFVSPSNQRKR
jgi:hypothetical protein